MADEGIQENVTEIEEEPVQVESDTVLQEPQVEESSTNEPQNQNGDNKDKEKDRERSRERSRSGRRDRRRSRSRSPHRTRSHSRSRSRSRDRRPRDRGYYSFRSTRILVKNMPYELRWQDIKDLFRKEVGEVAYVEMIEGNDGKPRGMAVLEFKDKDTARKAIETMHQYKVHDRYLVVNEEREKDRRMYASIGHVPGGGSSGGGGGGGRGGMGDMRGGGGLGPGMGLGGGLGLGMPNPAALGLGGLTPDILAQLGIDGPITNTVFVANLDYKVTSRKLKEVFGLAGHVVKAEVKEDKTGKSRGMGTVTFEQLLEAVQAVSMFNGQFLFDRRMFVRIDKLAEDIPPPGPKLPSGLKSIGMGLGLGGSPLTNIGQVGSGGGIGLGSGLGAGLGSAGLGGLGGGLGAGAGLGLGIEGLGSMGLGGLGGLSGLGSLGSGLGSSGLSGLGLSGGLGGMGSSLSKLGIEGLGGLGGMDSGLLSSGAGDGRSSYRDSDRGGRREERTQRFTRPDNCTVLVKNLPYAVTWQDLRERFQDIGDVKYAEIRMEKGRSLGEGLVRYGNEDDALRAISTLDRTRFEGRTIEVVMYRG